MGGMLRTYDVEEQTVESLESKPNELVQKGSFNSIQNIPNTKPMFSIKSNKIEHFKSIVPNYSLTKNTDNTKPIRI